MKEFRVNPCLRAGGQPFAYEVYEGQTTVRIFRVLPGDTYLDAKFKAEALARELNDAEWLSRGTGQRPAEFGPPRRKPAA